MRVMQNIAPIVLAGGPRSKSKPYASNKIPTFFAQICMGRSLFQETVLRAVKFNSPIVICHEAYYPVVLKQLKEVSVKPRAIILEPEHKGTATTIALAAFYLKDKSETMLILPSDHVLGSEDDFEELVYSAAEQVTANNIVTLGTRALYANTSFGYIICEHGDDSLYKVKLFYEKPTNKQAHDLVDIENCFWNTGVFLTHALTFLRELRHFEPELYKFTERAFYSSEENDRVYTVVEEDFSRILPTSVENAVLEMSSIGYMYEMPVSWSDAGTWPRLLRLKVRSIFKKEKNDRDETNTRKRAS